MTAAEFLAQLLQSDKVPTLPGVAAEVLRLSADSEVDLRLIATTIAHDASLSAKILQYVNSPLYGFSQSIGTLSQAVAILGMDAVRSLVLSFTLVDATELGTGGAFDYQRFWERSLAMAVAAQRIADDCSAISGEEAFLAGLLANLGEVFPRPCPSAAICDLQCGKAPCSRDVFAAGNHAWRIGGRCCQTLGTAGVSVRRHASPRKPAACATQ